MGTSPTAKPRPDWRQQAACRDLATALFFPVGNSDITRADEARAKAVCQDCAVSEDCLAFALVTDQSYGVWGGLEPRRASGEGKALMAEPETIAGSSVYLLGDERVSQLFVIGPLELGDPMPARGPTRVCRVSPAAEVGPR